MKVIVLLFFIFLISCDTPQTGGTAGPNFIKKGDINGNVQLSNVKIVLYKADIVGNIDFDTINITDSSFYNSYYSTVSAIDTVVSDENGYFVFKDIEEGVYSLEANSSDSSMVYYEQNIVFNADSNLALDTIVLVDPGSIKVDIYITDSLIKTGLTKGDIHIVLQSTHYSSNLIGNGYALFENIMPGNYLLNLYTKKDGVRNDVVYKEISVYSNKMVYDTIKGTTPPRLNSDNSILVSNVEYNDVVNLIGRNHKTIDLLSSIDTAVEVRTKIIKIIEKTQLDTILYPLLYTKDSNVYIPLNIEQIPKIDNQQLFISFKLDELIYGFDAIPIKGDYIKIYNAAKYDLNNNLIKIDQ